MPALHFASVSLHVLAAMAWLGGMLFLGMAAPVLRSVEPADARQRLFRDIGMRFRSVGWAAIGTLVVTGVANLHFRGWLYSLGDPAFWTTTAGRSLAVKLAAAAVMVAISAVHDFVHGPRASRLAAGTPEAVAARRRAMLLARINAVVGVIVVLAAVRLARS